MTKILIAILVIVLIFGEIVAMDFITSLHFHSDVVCVVWCKTVLDITQLFALMARYMLTMAAVVYDRRRSA